MDHHPFDFLNTQETGVTIEQAAAQLGLGRSTIYKYIKENKLSVVSAAHSTRILISEQSLESLKQTHTLSDAISLFKLSQELHISRERILAIAESENIELVKGSYGNREQYIISPAVKRQLEAALQKQQACPRSLFYNRTYGIVLHQLFYSRNSTSYYRISNENGLWGIHTPAGLIPYEQAVEKYELEAVYPILGKYRKKEKYCELQIALTDPSFYKVMDTLYIASAIQNLDFRLSPSGMLHVQIREGRYPVKNTKFHPYLIDLRSFITNGQLEYAENHIFIFISSKVELRVAIDPAVMAVAVEQAKQLNLTNDEYIQLLIERDVKTSES